MKTALLSVSNKEGVADFASFLSENGYRILSTGGTYNHLMEAGIAVKTVQEITGFPEILDGRVKTLHPKIHGGILAKRNKDSHISQMQNHGIDSIDLVCVNLYPFFENADKDLSDENLVEFIDIGGPTMLRAAAKSYHDVTVITDPEDYKKIQDEILENENSHLQTRKYLAAKVFNLTSAYDAAVAEKLFSEEVLPTFHNSSYKKRMDLRYGENPHQKGAFYTKTTGQGSMKDFEQLSGKELSFNNIRDMDLAWKVVCEFEETACCAVKHSTPCGVALDESLTKAYQKAHDCDPISIFGGIVAFNREVDEETANKMSSIFLEIVVAKGFSEPALSVLKKKKNLRIIKTEVIPSDKWYAVQVDGGLLVQETDRAIANELKPVTENLPDNKAMDDMHFALKVIKHVKSNAIVVAKNKQALGVGTGETNRIWATQQAIERAKEKEQDGLVMASDAFFPFRDVVDFAAENGISAIVQPGGSIRDQESIDAANSHNLAMCFTGIRHFLH